MFCKYCGIEVQDTDIFCSSCGKMLDLNNNVYSAPPKSVFLKWWFWLTCTVAIVFIFSFSYIMSKELTNVYEAQEFEQFYNDFEYEDDIFAFPE